VHETDVLVIGSEGAGARAAIAAADAGAAVMIVTKGRQARSGATLTGAADLDVDSATLHRLIGRGDPDDSPEAFFRDIVVEGKYLNDQPLVEAHVQDVPRRAEELLGWGLRIYDLRQNPGHSYPRNMYTSGHDLAMLLRRQTRKRPITVVEDTLVTDLLVTDGRVVGAMALDLRSGEAEVLHAKAVVLATGGGHNLFSSTTGPEDLTGDGQAMALRAGAALVNMEMTQFIPTTIINPPMARGNLFPFLLGPNDGLHYWLLNKKGERFMARWDPERMERSTRDLLSIGIMTEVLEGRGGPEGGVYYSLAHLPKNLVEDFARWGAKPFIKADWSAHGHNFREVVDRLKAGDAIEVSAAAHFFMGGVQIDESVETGVPGLYAAGEVTGGLHGANRLSGNAFTQIVTQGARSGEAAAAFARREGAAPPPAPAALAAAEERVEAPLRREGGVVAFELRRELQEVADTRVGVLRTGAGLQEAVARIDALRREALPRVSSRAHIRRFNPEWIECLQVENMLTTLLAIARAALLREESRGAHYRRDFPNPDNARWLRNTVATLRGEELELTTAPVRFSSLRPDGEVPPPTHGERSEGEVAIPPPAPGGRFGGGQEEAHDA
jgi:succinate dehydrogenase/fumarate reductase flavoprotein subunit